MEGVWRCFMLDARSKQPYQNSMVWGRILCGDRACPCPHLRVVGVWGSQATFGRPTYPEMQTGSRKRAASSLGCGPVPTRAQNHVVRLRRTVQRQRQSMSLQIIQPWKFTKREVCPVDRSSSLTARFSAIFRDFPNTRPLTA